jgi:hypothetical protein
MVSKQELAKILLALLLASAHLPNLVLMQYARIAAGIIPVGLRAQENAA